MGPKIQNPPQKLAQKLSTKTIANHNLPMGIEAISPYPHSHHCLTSHSLSLPSTSHTLSLSHQPTNQNLHHHNFPLLRSFATPDSTKFSVKPRLMAAMNSSVLACNYAISGTELSSKASSLPCVATPVASVQKLPVIRAQQARVPESNESGRRAALLGLGAALFTAAVSSSTSDANAGVIEDYLEKSKANKELNDKKRLATSGANFARAYTVQFGTCKFPENFTGCQDLAKQKKVPFLSEDLELECEGKDKFKCGSNVFWKW